MVRLVGQLGLLVRRLNPRIKESQGDSAAIAAWYVEPGQTAVEFLVVLVWLGVFFGTSSPVLTEWTYDPKLQREFDTFDMITGVFVGVHCFTLFFFKIVSNRTWFLFQPCNMWVFGVTYVHFSRGAPAEWLFNMYLHSMWGSWEGLLAADIREVESIWEIVNFFSLHVVIIVVPIYHIVRGTFVVYTADIFGCGTLLVMYYYILCLPLSVYSGWNISYMTVPPKEVVLLGKWYRIIMTIVSFPLGALMRLGLTSAVIWLANR